MSSDRTFPTGKLLVGRKSNARYRVIELIGEGGMGQVYKGQRVDNGLLFAIKCLKREYVGNKKVELRNRFEAVAFSTIDHPNVVRVHDTGTTSDNVDWMAMDLLVGQTLAEICTRMGKLPMPWAITIVRDLCRGLGAIHEHVVHRDIKPGNAHLGSDAITRALDLGAAKPKERSLHLTSTGYQLGTFAFMSPEQLENAVEIDLRTDIWSVGVLLYLLVTGCHPFAFEGCLPDSQFAVGNRIIGEPHMPIRSIAAWVPSYVADLIDKALAKNRDKRFRSAHEFAMLLTAALDRLAADLGGFEPLTTLAAQLAPKAEPLDLARLALPSLVLASPRGTIPMAPPRPVPLVSVDAGVGALPSALAGEAGGVALAYARTSLVPERVLDVEGRDREAVLPGGPAHEVPSHVILAQGLAVDDEDSGVVDSGDKAVVPGSGRSEPHGSANDLGVEGADESRVVQAPLVRQHVARPAEAADERAFSEPALSAGWQALDMKPRLRDQPDWFAEGSHVAQSTASTANDPLSQHRSEGVENLGQPTLSAEPIARESKVFHKLPTDTPASGRWQPHAEVEEPSHARPVVPPTARTGENNNRVAPRLDSHARAVAQSRSPSTPAASGPSGPRAAPTGRLFAVSVVLTSALVVVGAGLTAARVLLWRENTDRPTLQAEPSSVASAALVPSTAMSALAPASEREAPAPPSSVGSAADASTPGLPLAGAAVLPASSKVPKTSMGQPAASPTPVGRRPAAAASAHPAQPSPTPQRSPDPQPVPRRLF